MTGKPAATLLHVGPGLANGLANLHNAKRAYSPVVNMAGDYPSHTNDPLRLRLGSVGSVDVRMGPPCLIASDLGTRCGGCGRRGARGPGRNLDRPARRHMG